MGRALAALGAIAAAMLAAPAAAGAAEAFYAVTQSNRLVTFASDSPGNIRTSVPISGLLENENVVALDVRPATDTLYGIGSSNRLYRISPASGQAVGVGTRLFDVSPNGQSIGFDSDPVADVFRLVSDGDTNFRIDPSTGEVIDGKDTTALVNPDADLHYAEGDAGFGVNPSVGSIAYTHNVAGATDTQLFGLESARDVLVRQDPQNDGVLHTVGSLGVDATEPSGLDVARSGLAYAAFRRQGRSDVELFRLDLATGRARRATRFDAVGTYLGTRRDPIRALATAGVVPDDRTRPGVTVAPVRNPTVRQLLRGRALRLVVSCSEACSITATLRSGRRTVGRARRSIRERAGITSVRLRLSRSGRRVVRRHPRRRLRLSVTARDAAGNVTRTRPG